MRTGLKAVVPGWCWCLVAVLCLTHPVFPQVKTDRGVYPEPALPALPPVGDTLVDPTFGTTLLRVTGPADGQDCHNAYSYWPGFNCHSTRLHISCDGTAYLYAFDPDSFKVTGPRQVLFAANPQGGIPNWEDAIWSGQDPDILYCHSGQKLWKYNVATRTYALVKDFGGLLPPGYIRQMSKSADDNVFSFTRQDPAWAVVGYLVWQRDIDSLLLDRPLPPEDLDEVQLDKSGRYLIVKTGSQGDGIIQAYTVDLVTGQQEALIDNAPDFAPGHSDCGYGSVVGADNWQNRLTFRRLATPHQFHSVVDFNNDWSQDYHVSLLADDESWVCLSLYVGNQLPSSGVFKNEIMQVATDGSQQVRRLAHHRSVVGDYWDSPRATISYDGRFILFTSNWGGSLGPGQRAVFILKVPPAPTGVLAAPRRPRPEAGLTIIPNPACSMVTIGFTPAYSRDAVVSIFDTGGSMLWGRNLTEGQSRFTWQAGDLPASLYLVKIVQGSATYAAPFVVNGLAR